LAIHPIDYRYGSREMRDLFEEESRVQRYLDVEAALARAYAGLGSIPKKEADAIAGKASTEYVKLARIKEIEKETKHDLMAVVEALAEVCGESGRYVHLGATSYDIVDTAQALQLRDALGIVERDLFEIEGVLLGLAERHIDTVAVGRTHGQHGVPTTYGLKFAIWAREVRRHIERLKEVRKRAVVGKMSGAVGTQASFCQVEGIDAKRARKLQELCMSDLGVGCAEVSNQVIQRDRHAEVICLLALIAGTFEKIGKEVRNLQRTEIAEVSEAFEAGKQVGSSTMPHKRNPITSEKICGLARVVRSNVSVALENIALEHERDLTNSSSERAIIPESFVLLDEILKSAKRTLSGLVFNEENMAANLEKARGLNMAEAVMIELTEKGLSRSKAHETLRRLSTAALTEKKGLKEVLLADKEALKLLGEGRIRDLLEPSNYLGSAKEQVREVLKKAKKERS